MREALCFHSVRTDLPTFSLKLYVTGLLLSQKWADGKNEVINYLLRCLAETMICLSDKLNKKFISKMIIIFEYLSISSIEIFLFGEE